MSDIRHALLRRDPLSAAKEVLYHLDISLGSASAELHRPHTWTREEHGGAGGGVHLSRP